MYRWMYICDFSRSVGVGSAMCLNTRGLVRSVIRRIVPPLPAESRPSNTMHTFAPVPFTHSCMATSSPCRRRISFSYSFVFIFVGVGESVAPPSAPGSSASTTDVVDASIIFGALDLPSRLRFLLIRLISLSTIDAVWNWSALWTAGDSRPRLLNWASLPAA